MYARSLLRPRRFQSRSFPVSGSHTELPRTAVKAPPAALPRRSLPVLHPAYTFPSYPFPAASSRSSRFPLPQPPHRLPFRYNSQGPAAPHGWVCQYSNRFYPGSAISDIPCSRPPARSCFAPLLPPACRPHEPPCRFHPRPDHHKSHRIRCLHICRPHHHPPPHRRRRIAAASPLAAGIPQP